METKDANSVYASKADDFLRQGDKKIKGFFDCFLLVCNKKNI